MNRWHSSLPHHIDNGWFGGLLPATALAIVAQTGNMRNGLRYPIIVAGATFVIGMLFVRETKDITIYATDKPMWKYIAVLVLFAALAMWMIAKYGGNAVMGGEKHEVPASTSVQSAPKK